MSYIIGTTVEIIKEQFDIGINAGDIGVITGIDNVSNKYNIHFCNNKSYCISFKHVKIYYFKKDDKVQICSKNAKVHNGDFATVVYNYNYMDGYVYVNFTPKKYPNRQYDGQYHHTSIRLVSNETFNNNVNNEREENNMKLTGFNKVAVINISNNDYYYALYDNDIKTDDNVLVTGRQIDHILTVKDILTLEECSEKFNINKICEEIMCKVDLSAYNTRLDNRKKAVELKKKMDAKIAAMDEMNKYVMYAERNPELAKMLEEYRELV